MFPALPGVKAFARRKLPILGWLPRYTKTDYMCDLLAGTTVGLTLIPQAIAYAGLAGLGPQYGLYSGWVGCLVYIVFGSTRQISVGPTALVSLLTFTYTHHLNADAAVLLCFLSGLVSFLFGVLHLGVLVDFVSSPVSTAFTAAAAFTIASSQLKSLFGLKYNTEAFLDTWRAFVSHLLETNKWDLILGVCCIVTLLLLRSLKEFEIKEKETSRTSSVVNPIIWFLRTGRNAIVVLCCAVLAWSLERYGYVPFTLTGAIETGLPHIGPPPFSTVIDGKTIDFLELVQSLGGGIVVVPLVSIVSNVAIAKAFSKGEKVDASQEMIALGLCNMVGSLARSMPVAGAFSRSAVNNASGVRTTLGGAHTSALVVLSIGLLTPYFRFIPRSSLAAVIMCAVVFLVDFRVIRPMWISNRRDLICVVATFATGLLFGVELGLVVGVLVNIAFMLYNTSRPKLVEPPVLGGRHWVLQLQGPLYFPAIDYVREEIIARASSRRNCPLVFDMAYVTSMDYTAAQGIARLMEDLRETGTEVIVMFANEKVLRSLRQATHKLIVANSEQHLEQILSDGPKKNSDDTTLTITNENTL